MQNVEDSVEKGDRGAGEVVLYGFGSYLGQLSCISPFVGKVEVFLRMNNIPYRVERITDGLKGSPKGTMPYIKHGDVCLADSTFILDYLTNTFGDKIIVKSPSDARQAGIAVAVQRMCEDHLGYGIMWHRIIHEEGFKQIKPIFLRDVRFPMTMFLAPMFRKQAFHRLKMQGFGRHSEKDLLKILDKSLGALSGIIGKNKYITGSEPCPQDCSVFGFLDCYLNARMNVDTLHDLAAKYPNLVAYMDNMKNTYFPDNNPSKFREKPAEE